LCGEIEELKGEETSSNKGEQSILQGGDSSSSSSIRIAIFIAIEACTS
jgi:hypothetical protein